MRMVSDAISQLFENLARIQDRVCRAANRSGRNPSAIELMAVSKQASPEALKKLILSGKIQHIGENKVQSAIQKITEAKGWTSEGAAALQWHLIGHLQSNKIKKAAEAFDWIDSIDRFDTAEKLDSIALGLGKKIKILIQVNIAGNPKQSGIAPENLGDFLSQIAGLNCLQMLGLMALAPPVEPVEDVRPYFRRTKDLFDRFFKPSSDPASRCYLSMGMSRDFEIAVEEGADLIRIGSALFSGG